MTANYRSFHAARPASTTTIYDYKSTILLIVVFREEEKSQQRFYDMIACKKGFRVASPASDPYTLLLLLYILICGPHGHPKKARSVLLLLLLCVCVCTKSPRISIVNFPGENLGYYTVV
jgi:hypothetical protein